MRHLSLSGTGEIFKGARTNAKGMGLQIVSRTLMKKINIVWVEVFKFGLEGKLTSAKIHSGQMKT